MSWFFFWFWGGIVTLYGSLWEVAQWYSWEKAMVDVIRKGAFSHFDEIHKFTHNFKFGELPIKFIEPWKWCPRNDFKTISDCTPEWTIIVIITCPSILCLFPTPQHNLWNPAGLCVRKNSISFKCWLWRVKWNEEQMLQIAWARFYISCSDEFCSSAVTGRVWI